MMGGWASGRWKEVNLGPYPSVSPCRGFLLLELTHLLHSILLMLPVAVPLFSCLRLENICSRQHAASAETEGGPALTCMQVSWSCQMR